jgi:hypothetical protein
VLVTDLGAGPRLIADASGGAFVTWRYPVLRDWCYTYYRFAHHVLPAGALDSSWPAGGVFVGPAGREITDGTGGLLAAGSAGIGWYARWFWSEVTRISADGTRPAGWESDGDGVCSEPIDQREPDVAPDGAGGAFLTWIDHRT